MGRNSRKMCMEYRDWDSFIGSEHGFLRRVRTAPWREKGIRYYTVMCLRGVCVLRL